MTDPIITAGCDVQRDGVYVTQVLNEHGFWRAEWHRDGRVMTTREIGDYLRGAPRPARFSPRRIFAALRGWAICRGRSDVR